MLYKRFIYETEQPYTDVCKKKNKKRLTTQVYKRITFCALQTLKNKTKKERDGNPTT